MIQSSSFKVGVLALAVALPVAGMHSDASAQTRSLTWTETTRVEVPGMLGGILGAFGITDPKESQASFHVQGRRYLQEDGQVATIVDLENGRWVMVDHNDRTYLTMTFDDLAQMSAEAMAATREAAQSAANQAEMSAEREELRRTLEEADATLEVRVRSESGGQRQNVGGVNASQHFVMTDFEATAVPEGVDQREGGSMLFLTELWMTEEVPSAEALLQEMANEMANDPRFREMANEIAESARGAGADMANVLGMWNPQVGVGMQRAAEEIDALPGTMVRSTTTIAMVPLGMEANRNELMAWAPQTAGEQLRGEAAGAARSAVADAARSAIGGLFGGRRSSAPEPPAPEADATPRVQPFMRISIARENMTYRESSDDPFAALEARIADYQGRTFADMMSEMQR